MKIYVIFQSSVDTINVINYVFFFLNRTKEAQEVYERALFYDSTNPDIYYNVSIFFILIYCVSFNFYL